MDILKYNINVKDYIDIYQKALKNIYFVKQYPNFKRKISILVYYIFSFLLKYKELNSKKIYFHYSNKEAEIEGFDDFAIVYYGKRNRISEYFSHPSFYLYMTRIERIKLFYYAKKTHHNCNREIPFAYWLEFLSFDYFLFRNKVSILMTNDHYSKVGTSLSLLCEYRKISYYIKQHGFMLREPPLPQKLYCNRVYSFDDTEAHFFKKNLVTNSDCEYINRYVDFIEFKTIECDEKIIAVIENKSPDMKPILKSVTQAINEANEKYRMYIILHPMSKKKDYEEFIDNNVFFTRERIGNAEIVVSSISTLFYNYLRSGYKGKIMVVETAGIMEAFGDKYLNLEYYDDLNKFGKSLKEILEK